MNSFILLFFVIIKKFSILVIDLMSILLL